MNASSSELLPAEPYSPAFCEREYNARAAVPEHKDYLIRWASRSAMTRSKLSCYLDLAYGQGDKRTLDFFPCAAPRGLLVFIHGGYWRGLDKSDFSFLAEAFVAESIAVAALNYPLCPTVTVPEIVEDCAKGFAWICNAAHRFGLADRPIVLAGHSAGGHLAAMLSTLDWDERRVDVSRVKGTVAISGLYDLEPLLRTSMNDDIRLDDAQVRAASPVQLSPRLDKPLLLFSGDRESGEFQRQSRLLHAAWPAVCRPPVGIPACHHFSVVDSFADPNSACFRSALALFD